MKMRLNIDDALVRDAKVFAARQGKCLTRQIEEGLRMRTMPRRRCGFALQWRRTMNGTCRIVIA